MKSKDLSQIKRQLAMIVASSSTVLGNVDPALAIQGKVSYTEFMNAVDRSEIKTVMVGPSGTWAEFVNSDMSGGSVNLIKDPNFIDIMTSKGVNLM
jgi:hypothetical protein